MYLGCGICFRGEVEDLFEIEGSKQSDFCRALKLEALNCRFIWRGVRTEGGGEMVDIIAGEFELPAGFENESSWIFNLWNSRLISESKAESFVAVDWRRFKIWNLRRKDLPEVGQFLGINETAKADKGGIFTRKKNKVSRRI